MEIIVCKKTVFVKQNAVNIICYDHYVPLEASGFENFLGGQVKAYGSFPTLNKVSKILPDQLIKLKFKEGYSNLGQALLSYFESDDKADTSWY